MRASKSKQLAVHTDSVKKISTSEYQTRGLLNRRAFGAASLSALVPVTIAQHTGIPVIDTHVHFYDSTRPQGVPYPSGNTIPGIPVALPGTLRKVVNKLDIVGAIEVEASPWVEDNLWVLEVSAKDPLVVGFIGNLEPDKPEFREYLDRYAKHKLFRGIRYGNLWNRTLAAAIEKPEFIAGMKYFASADLTLDTANPSVELLQSVLRLTDRVPGLRVVLDHLPALEVSPEPTERKLFESTIQKLAERNVYAKLSAVTRRINGQVISDLASYKPRLDVLFEVFGEDKVIYGSDWPNSTGNWVPYATALLIVQQYFGTKSRSAAEKYFWKNSIPAYKWIRRDARQPTVSGG